MKDQSSKSAFIVSTGGGAYASAADIIMGATHAYYIVGGSATRAINGKYSRSGRFGGAPCFKNENDILLFRATLQETPELGITSRDLCVLSLQDKVKTEAKTTHDLDMVVQAAIDSDPNGEKFKSLAKLGRRLAVLDDLERTRRRKELSIQRERNQVTSENSACDRKLLI